METANEAALGTTSETEEQLKSSTKIKASNYILNIHSS